MEKRKEIHSSPPPAAPVAVNEYDANLNRLTRKERERAPFNYDFSTIFFDRGHSILRMVFFFYTYASLTFILKIVRI